MMKEIQLGHLSLELTQEKGSVRVRFNERNILLAEQDTANVSLLLGRNFSKVHSFYLEKIAGSKIHFDPDDISSISIAIVLYYLSMYNSWRIRYRTKKYDNLDFRDGDFTNPSTSDAIFRHFKAYYPDDWVEKCSVLMDMTPEDLKEYYKSRELYYNK